MTDTEIVDELERYIRQEGGIRLHTGDYEAGIPGLVCGQDWGTLRQRMASIHPRPICPGKRKKK